MLKMIILNFVKFIPWNFRILIKDIPIISQIQRLIFKVLLSNTSFEFYINDGPFKGLKYWIELPQDKGLWVGNYEIEVLNAIISSISKNSICFDVGSYRGYIAGAMAVNGAEVVFAFDPLPTNIDQIQKMITLNPHLKIQACPIALGDQDGLVTFKVMPQPSMGKLESSPFQKLADAEETLEIQMKKIDTLVFTEKLPAPTLIKIDVEGAEFKVLQGCENVLRCYHPNLIIECHSKLLALQCYEYLSIFSYKSIVLETQHSPADNLNLEICHLVCKYFGKA